MLDSWHDVRVLWGMALVMLEFVQVACFLPVAIGHAEKLI